MKEEFLPIGSVVQLKNTNKRLMITGFYVKPNTSEIYYDYLGCIFPEGMISEHENYIFNNEQIEKVCHLGLVDEEETSFKTKLYGIIDSKMKEKNNRNIISVPINIYNQYNFKKDNIISIPIDKYNEMNHKKISIPSDLYKELNAKKIKSSDMIIINSSAYEKYKDKQTGAQVIRIPSDKYKKSVKKEIISLPFDAYKKAISQIICLPLNDYNKILNSKSVISINAKTYEELLMQENGMFNEENDYEKNHERMINIPADLYKKLKENSDIISVPLKVYENLLKRENHDKIISIPLSEYEKITNGTEKNGMIKLPSNVYNEILKKDISDIDNKKQIIEIPYDLYKRTSLESN